MKFGCGVQGKAQAKIAKWNRVTYKPEIQRPDIEHPSVANLVTSLP